MQHLTSLKRLWRVLTAVKNLVPSFSVIIIKPTTPTCGTFTLCKAVVFRINPCSCAQNVSAHIWVDVLSDSQLIRVLVPLSSAATLFGRTTLKSIITADGPSQDL